MEIRISFLLFLTSFSYDLEAYGQEYPSQSIEMVKVDSGILMLGAQKPEHDEFPLTKVHIASFSIGKYEVTQAQWGEIMGNSPSYHSNCDSCPVENVSWNEIQIFIGQLNFLTGKKYRLPTEFEWEFAARGGAKSRGYQFSGANDMEEVGWTWKNTSTIPMPVGKKMPNELGIYDMSGNVAEFTSSNLNDSYEDYLINGTYHKIFRGGSYANASDYFLSKLSYRNHKQPRLRDWSVGFRLASD